VANTQAFGVTNMSLYSPSEKEWRRYYPRNKMSWTFHKHRLIDGINLSCSIKTQKCILPKQSLFCYQL